MKKEMMLALTKMGQESLNKVLEEAHSDILIGELNGVLAMAVLDDLNIDVLTIRRDMLRAIYEVEEIHKKEMPEDSAKLIDETFEWIDNVLDNLDEMESDLAEIEEQIAEQEDEGDYYDDYIDTLDCGCCACCGCSCDDYEDYDDGYEDDNV